MDVRALRKHCEQLLQTLELKAPFDLNVFCNRLADQLDVPIELVAQRLPPETPGRSIWFTDRLVIAYERDTSLFHQQYIIFHELGHILLRHSFSETVGSLSWRVSLDAEGIKSALARSEYGSLPEQEAEIFASLLTQRVAPTPIVSTRYRSDDPRTRQLEDFMAGLL